MKKQLVLFGSVLSLCLMAFSSLAAADTLDTIRQRKKIIIAVDIGTPPFGMIDAQARQSGSDIESAQLLAKDLGVELEVVPVTGANRIPFLMTRKVDVVMSSFVITEERKKVIDFSNPYGVLKIGIAGPAKPKVTSFAELSGKTVAATRGTTADQELVRGVKDIPGVNIVRFEDDATTSTAVATGQQDYFAAPITAIPGIKRSNPNRDIELKFVMMAQPYGIGLRKNEPQLKAYLDGWVQTNLKNGKLDGIYKKYFGASLPAEMLN
jgi:polar amino acid transport system substrate-binding protein